MNGRFSEYVLADLLAWRAQGKRTALLTLYNVEPTGPRPAGSQMASSDSGDFTGFLSGGCVEGALVEEAKAAMAEGKNRTIRYGVNSPYFDIELPCGSAIDVYIDVGFSDAGANALNDAMDNRHAVRLLSDMQTGINQIETLAGDDDRAQLILDGNKFDRLYRPPLRLVIAGKGPVVAASAEIARASDIEVHVISSEDATRSQAEAVSAKTYKTTRPELIDTWTAVATLFHEHELEVPVLGAAMTSDAFYIGALGSRSTHADRVSRFIEDGYSEEQVKRIKGPLGISIGSRNPPEIAISMIAEVLQTYRGRFAV